MFQWVAMPLIAAAFLAGGPAAAGAAAPSAALATTAPVLVQTGPASWTATVLVTGYQACSDKLNFGLVTTPASGVKAVNPAHWTAAPGVSGPGCASEVTVDFTNLPFAPASASLVLSQPGTSTDPPATVAVTVQRQLPSVTYLWLPFGCGLGLALLFVAGVLGYLRIRPVSDTAGGRLLGFPLYAAAAWTFSDSWATNIAGLTAAITAIMAATSSVAALFPGVQLGDFSILLAATGAIVGIAPLVFAALRLRSASADPSAAGVAVVSLPPGPVPSGARRHVRLEPERTGLVTQLRVTVTEGGNRSSSLIDGATIFAPAGASILLDAGAHYGTPARHVAPGKTLTVPPGSRVTVYGGSAAVPGTSDIALDPGQGPSQQCLVIDAKVASPEICGETVITLAGSAKISLTGAGEITLPERTAISVPLSPQAGGSAPPTLAQSTTYLIPHSGDVLAGKLWQVLAAACVTLFGIGAQFGLLGGLVLWLSDISRPGKITAGLCLLAAFLIVLLYGIATTHALADRRPGSAMSVTAATSFTL